MALRNDDLDMQRYGCGGYATLLKCTYELKSSRREFARIRRPGDSLTWEIPFDTSGIQPAKSLDEIPENVSFVLGTNEEGPGRISFDTRE